MLLYIFKSRNAKKVITPSLGVIFKLELLFVYKGQLVYEGKIKQSCGLQAATQKSDVGGGGVLKCKDQWS